MRTCALGPCSSLARTGEIALPWGPEGTAIPLVSAEDVARVAAAVLTGPVLKSGTVVRLMAGAITNKEIADAFGEILGRPVQYVEVSDDQWASTASALGVNAVAVEHLTHLWRYLRTRPPENRPLSHQRRVRRLHQPATTVSPAVPATAQKSVRRCGGANERVGELVRLIAGRNVFPCVDPDRRRLILVVLTASFQVELPKIETDSLPKLLLRELAVHPVSFRLIHVYYQRLRPRDLTARLISRTSPARPHGRGDGLRRFRLWVVAHTCELSHLRAGQHLDGLFKNVTTRHGVVHAPHEMQWAIPIG